MSGPDGAGDDGQADTSRARVAGGGWELVLESSLEPHTETSPTQIEQLSVLGRTSETAREKYG